MAAGTELLVADRYRV